MKWKLTCLTTILTCSSRPQQTANIHADSVPKAGADNQMWSRLWLSLLTLQGWEEAALLGLQSISSSLDNPSKRDSSIPSPCGMFWGRGFLLLADGKPTRESVVAGAQGILGWGVALQNINSLQLFNVIQTREAEFVFTGCECSSTFLDQICLPQGTGLQLRFCIIPI